jgi:acyl-CoA reductase-like NAD-dependent aldehyde dehydrogenase
LRIEIPKNLKIENRPFINGSFYSVKNPIYIKKKSITKEFHLPNLIVCGDKEISFAIKSAEKSFENGNWKNLDNLNKKKIFFEAANLIKAQLKEISLIDCLETGRSIINFERDSIPKCVSVIEYFAESVDKIYDKMNPLNQVSLGLITRKPFGVVASLTSWNDPLVPAMWKACPAILMGNSIIMKPSENSTFSLLKIAEIFSKAGLPDGIMNVITGDGNTGKKIVSNDKIKAIYFTGSAKTGKNILKISSKNKLKKVSLECGGKSCFIISRKCNSLKKAANVLAKNIFYNQGQICSAPSRLIIHKSKKSIFLKYLYKETLKYIPGDPLNYKTEVGALINKRHQEKIKNFFIKGKKEKNKYKIFKTNIWKKNYNFPPVIFYETKKNSVLLNNEIFGPILTCEYFLKNDEAIKIANNSDFGLAAAVWSDDFNEVHYFINRIEAGIIHINSYGEDDNSIPFGGIKDSGFGRDKSLLSFNEFTYQKSIYFKK